MLKNFNDELIEKAENGEVKLSISTVSKIMQMLHEEIGNENKDNKRLDKLQDIETRIFDDLKINWK